MKKIVKTMKWLAVTIISTLIIIVLWIRFSRFTDTMIYKTNGLTYDSFQTEYAHQEYYYEVDKNVKIHAVLFKPDSTISPIGTIIHYSGKGMHLMSSQKYYKSILDKGFQVFSFERRNFGKSTGTADNSVQLKKDALYVFDEITKHKDVIDTSIIIWGQSLGGAFAIMNAAERQEKIDGLIVEGTFSSFPDIGKVYANALHMENFKAFIPLLMNNDFPAEKEIKKIKKPVLVIHSYNDKQVPYKLGEKLYKSSNKDNTEFWKVKSKHIKALFDYEKEYIGKFLEMISN
ncbi:alpha/beta hydrolase [Aquimarina sp. Aq78]|uniref:alpha/beta hydrolase n=1 Tax=Aquimarina sp. Aq78 TaxID=1191889 RepID=UPI000D0E3857|nr:alpha/beta fold hydrolase [Aquimarina sp. Aq78]